LKKDNSLLAFVKEKTVQLQCFLKMFQQKHYQNGKKLTAFKKIRCHNRHNKSSTKNIVLRKSVAC
jgi:hypothetical protein